MNRTSNTDHLLQLTSIETDDCVLWDRGRKGPYGTVRAGRTAHSEACRFHHGEPPFIGAHAAHSCGVSLCVNPRHLRWATPAENIADKALHGTNLAGEGHNMVKLSASDVKAIRGCPDMPLRIIAAFFGISKSQAHRIRTGENWGGV